MVAAAQPGECPIVVLTFGAAGRIVFDCGTPDQVSESGTTWCWENLEGWWELPPPQRSTLVGPGGPSGTRIAADITSARWGPRPVTLTVNARLFGSAAALRDAYRLVAGFGIPETSIGILEVYDLTPKAAIVRQRDGERITTEILGRMRGLRVTIPLIAHDPRRSIISIPGVSVL